MALTIDFRQLQSLVAVAEKKSFKAAARALSVTPSAVSHSITSLEEQCECELFDRVGKSTHLNDAGKNLFDHAKKIFSQMEEAQRDLLNLRRWGHGRLRIGVGYTACQYILPTVLREFRESFPKCDIVIETGNAPDLFLALEQNRIEMVISLKPQKSENILFKPLFQDELLFIVDSSHPWAQKKAVPRAEIPLQTHIIYNKVSYSWAMVERYFAQENISLGTAIEVSSYEAIKELVKARLGIAVMAAWVVEKELKEGSLVALPLGKRKLTRQWGIASHKWRKMSLAEETFLGLCGSYAKNLASQNKISRS